MENKEGVTWRKSSYSSNGGDACVEITSRDGTVLVRDTKDRTGPVHQFTAYQWRAFVAGVRAGDFD